MPEPDETVLYLPQTVDEAVMYLMNGLALRDKTDISMLDQDELYLLNPTLGAYIRDQFGLSNGLNPVLMKSCRTIAGDDFLHPEMRLQD